MGGAQLGAFCPFLIYAVYCAVVQPFIELCLAISPKLAKRPPFTDT